jgi:hypothetical protein
MRQGAEAFMRGSSNGYWRLRDGETRLPRSGLLQCFHGAVRDLEADDDLLAALLGAEASEDFLKRIPGLLVLNKRAEELLREPFQLVEGRPGTLGAGVVGEGEGRFQLKGVGEIHGQSAGGQLHQGGDPLAWGGLPDHPFICCCVGRQRERAGRSAWGRRSV